MNPEMTKVADRATPAVSFGREYGLDFLRVFAFLVLIFYHSGMIFVSWPFHIKNAETSSALEYLMLFFNRWRLPLLFFISGAGVAFSLRRRSLGAFAGERFVRLFVPLVFGMLFIVPPQIYFERLQKNQFSGSYLEFYPRVLEFVPYPAGAFSWHHLWFVLYILVYSLAALPLFAVLRSERGRAAIGRLTDWLERWPAAVYLINVPNLIVALTLGPRWPTTHNLVADWANLTGAFLTFLWGFVIASEIRLLDLITRRRREFLIVGVLLMSLFFGGRATELTRDWPTDARLLYGVFVSGYLGLAWIFALVGYARAWITRPSARLSYANEIVYPFYIVHQTVTIAVGYYVIQTALPIAMKLAIVAGATLAGSLAIVEVVRRVRPLRPLFGLRIRRP
jgi:peptidoglycan/LPS O-acetylase OafA/YrhL